MVPFTGTLTQVGVVPQVKLSDDKIYQSGDQEVKKEYIP